MGDDFDGQGEFAEAGDVFAFVGDADEQVGRAGDDFFAQERAAAAFDHLQRVVDFVCAVEIGGDAHDVGEGYFGDAVFFEHGGGGVRAAHRAFDGFAGGGQCLNEVVDGGAGADADVFVFGNEFDGFRAGHAFEIVLRCHVCSLFACCVWKKSAGES